MLSTKGWNDDKENVFFTDTPIVFLNYDGAQQVSSEDFAADLTSLPANRTAQHMVEDEAFVALQEVCIRVV